VHPGGFIDDVQNTEPCKQPIMRYFVTHVHEPHNKWQLSIMKEKKGYRDKKKKVQVATMGVRTKVFGSKAWTVLEGLARLYDHEYRESKDAGRKQVLEANMAALLHFLTAALPCTHCRRSLSKFIHPTQGPGDVKVEHYLRLSNGAKRLVYNLHNQVSRKLMTQEVHAARQSKKDEVRQKWNKHMISWEQALRVGYPSVTTRRWWDALFDLMVFIMCDFRESEASEIFMFFESVGRLLHLSIIPEVSEVGSLYIHTWGEIGKWLIDAEVPSDLGARIDAVYALHKRLRRHLGLPMTCTPGELDRQCTEKAIVACTRKIETPTPAKPRQ